jgi:hypothetical protein
MLLLCLQSLSLVQRTLMVCMVDPIVLHAHLHRLEGSAMLVAIAMPRPLLMTFQLIHRKVQLLLSPPIHEHLAADGTAWMLCARVILESGKGFEDFIGFGAVLALVDLRDLCGLSGMLSRVVPAWEPLQCRIALRRCEW